MRSKRMRNAVVPRARAVTALVLAATVCGGYAAPAAHAACARVRRSGPWTLADAPATTAAGPPDTAALVHGAATPVASTAPDGGVAGRRFYSDGISLFRSLDSGCTWQRTYTLDPAALASGPGDAAAAAAADGRYSISTVGTWTGPPGTRPTAGRDQVYLLIANTEPTVGLAQNLAALSPFFVARSADGGTTWHTDVLAAPLPGAANPVPVLGNATTARLLVAPSDPRTVYVHLVGHDPRAMPADPTSRVTYPTVYASRDGGASWSYVTTQDMLFSPLTVDAADAATLYGVTGHALDAIATHGTVTRRTLLTLPDKETVLAVDVTHPRGRPARLLVLSLQSPVYSLRRSTDGGRTWQLFGLPMLRTNAAPDPTAWLDPAGDVLTLRVASTDVYAALVFQRWSAARRRWLPARFVRPPLTAGAAGLHVWSLRTADTGHRQFSVYASEVAPLWREVAGIVDLDAL